MGMERRKQDFLLQARTMENRSIHGFPAVVAVFLLLALFPGQIHAGLADRYYTNGRELLTLGKYSAAAMEFQKAIAAFPDHVEARYQLALIYTGNVLTYEKAEQELLELPESAMRVGGQARDDILFRAGLALGKLYVRSGRHDQAIPLIKNVIASAPRTASLDDAYNTLGLALYYDRLYDDAIFELRRAIKQNPDNVKARFNLKTIRARLEHFQAGKIYARMGEQDEAISQFRRAIELDPRFVEARHRLGVVLLEKKDYANALKELRRADSISSRYRKAHEIWYAEGLALRSMGRNGEALKMIQKTIETKPSFAAAHNEAGKILLEQGKHDEAIPYFVKAIGIDPRTEYVRNLQITFSNKPP